jgi:hypothetical protein
MACLPGRATRPMSIDLGLVALTPQTGHCAWASSQALPWESLGKGWRAAGEKGPHPPTPFLGSLAVLRQQAKPWWEERVPPFLGIGLPPRLARVQEGGWGPLLPTCAATILEISLGICSISFCCRAAPLGNTIPRSYESDYFPHRPKYGTCQC